jgi:mannose-6-phosphate isomerase-like protein (cupin superfamily)
MRKTAVGILFAAVLVTFLMQTTSSQSRTPPTEATDVTKTEIEAVLKHPEGGGDRQIKVVDMGKYNVGVGVLHRNAIKPSATGTVNGIAHTQVTEVYYITSGSGTLVTGGTILNAKPLASDAEVVKVAVGPSVNGTFQGGQRRKVSAGDVVIIPPGVLHGWSEVEDHVTYLSVRPDADHVLPAGYVHPALKK